MKFSRILARRERRRCSTLMDSSARFWRMTIELPKHADIADENERRWAEVLADPGLAEIPGRVETDRYGKIIMSPPPAPRHGRFQFRIGMLLEQLMQGGEALTECPISTADGVKGCDVVWASHELLAETGNRVCFRRAPEICVEVRSPDNSAPAIAEKRRLYFDAGAREVWVCQLDGTMVFYVGGAEAPVKASTLCPLFPERIELRQF